jgi:ribokinase
MAHFARAEAGTRQGKCDERIVVVGSLNMDLVPTVEAMPREGETITGNSFSIHSGGKGGNQAVAIGRLGGSVEMIGALGDDAFAQQLEADLTAAGVGTAGIKHVPGSTGCATILVASSGSNSIVANPGANAHLLPEDLDRESARIAVAAVVLCQLETPLGTVEHLCRIISRTGACFVLDPAPAPKVPIPKDLLKRVTWLTPNETETGTLLSLLGHEPWTSRQRGELQRQAHIFWRQDRATL